jgi:CheY-like chemotaxis protein
MWWFQCGNPSVRWPGMIFSKDRFTPASGAGRFSGSCLGVPTAGCPDRKKSDQETGEIMDPAAPVRVPADVLIVEDDPIIALDFEDTILGLGVKSVRSAGNVTTALDMIASRAPEFAFLDVGLAREKSFAVAEKLDALKIPFAFVTGYGAEKVPPAFSDRPRLPKPCSSDSLLIVLQRFAPKL